MTKEQAIQELQKLVDEIVRENLPPFVNYLRAHQLGLIDSRLALVDRALDAGLVRVREVSDQ
jgi:hypothetical protein